MGNPLPDVVWVCPCCETAILAELDGKCPMSSCDVKTIRYRIEPPLPEGWESASEPEKDTHP